LRATIVVDLGFGDAGKGMLTDYLARHFQAGVVVRYNGGAQAGHNVTTADGRQHTFSQFGSGTFIPGVKTYLSRYVVIHPGALLVEGAVLEGKGVRDAFSRLRVSDQALVITPFHQAANRIREIARGADRHGSCGVGVGEAVEDAFAHPDDRVLAGDLLNPTMLRRKLQSIREQKRKQLVELCQGKSLGFSFAREWAIFENGEVIDAWIASISRMGQLGLVAPDSVLEKWLGQTEAVIFEGAQGVLLDAAAGFHPYTTWSDCTAQNALAMLKELAPDSSVFQIGALRSYAVRHGPGPLPTETDELTAMVSEQNKQNEWQGAVRYGWFDAVLARYALGIVGQIDALAVTHMDILPHLKTWKYCPGYTGDEGFEKMLTILNESGGNLRSFHQQRFLQPGQREQITRALFAVSPRWEKCASDEATVIPKIESLLAKPIGLISRGPRAEDVQILNPITRAANVFG
jgi:adenylosuccinate synthase